ncbi:MAG TPA: response regulator transcription factor [Gaiellaceae bacterium]
MTCVLVVDDESDIRGLLHELLHRAGHDVVEAPDGNEALKQFYANQPDLVILDVQMPGLDGWGVLDRIRELSDVPVIMLTARAEELDKVRGLRAGADDYVTKPFGRQELLARVEAHLRRGRDRQQAPQHYADAFVEVDFTQRAVRAGGEEVSLTPLEFRLLTAFVRHPNQLLSHDQLVEMAWGGAGSAERDQVKLYVGYLRRKLGEPPGGESPIETVRGFGYRYRAG